MATYTAVLVVPDGFSQDALQAFLESEQPNVLLTFLGPGTLVSGIDEPEPYCTEVERHAMTVDGLTVDVVSERTQDGIRLRLEAKTCDLDGDMPGEYWLTPLRPR